MKLNNIPKKNIYEVPADYFEKLPGVMMARVSEKERDRKIAPVFSWQVPWLKSAMAGLALLISFIYLLFVNTTQPVDSTKDQSTEILAAISKIDAMEYLINDEQVNYTDLALLSQSEMDYAHEFIQASEEDIMREVEFADINDITDNQ